MYEKRIAGKENIHIEQTALYSGYLVWNCTGVPSGVYLIFIKHGTASNVIKVIVAK